MKVVFILLLVWHGLVSLPRPGTAAQTPQQIIALAQQQLKGSTELALGELRVYREEQLLRFYSFVFGKYWDAATHTEYVRIDFLTAINSAIDSASLYSNQRYLLKRTAQAAPTQWLYLPALRRVRLTPYRPDDPLLQSDYLFYDLTGVYALSDYDYQFVDPDEQLPVLDGLPRIPIVPYQRSRFVFEQLGESYVVRAMVHQQNGTQRSVRLSAFRQVAPGRFRPHKIVVESALGRTEVHFRQWSIGTLAPHFFTPTALETKSLVFPQEKVSE